MHMSPNISSDLHLVTRALDEITNQSRLCHRPESSRVYKEHSIEHFTGIGRATALRLAELGAKVYALSLVQAELDSLHAENPAIVTLCVDLQDWEATREAVKKVTPIHLLVNIAVVFKWSPILKTSLADVNASLDVNVKGVLNVSQVVASDLITRGEKGNIVNMSSIGGQKPMIQTGIYSACKAAVDSFTRSMALELSSKGIRVNAVCPTLVTDTFSGQVMAPNRKNTETGAGNELLMARTPQGKFPCRNDVVNAVVYLLSDYSDLVNGHLLPVDGGFLCS
ncbi:L-xylulose reductase-like [Hyalella azteca]|uniref:L-xylulose reductase-like n=1 Tax=Hyalella azteca TaxID=294128 RepID=A0A8B7N7L7_HYAAZ|nr:L-xylulose reductase-like [Hyalella azteca]